jgi:hypothetical protein
MWRSTNGATCSGIACAPKSAPARSFSTVRRNRNW